MLDSTSLAIFIAAAIALALSPGPAVLFIVARSIEQGSKAGITSTLGIALASIIHIIFAALGLSTLLMQSALAFSIVKYFGATYLIYLGIRSFQARSEDEQIERLQNTKTKRLFIQGFIVNLLNPKTALFFLAFLPQFVNPANGSITLQIILLGSIFVGIAIVSDSLYAIAAGAAKKHLFGNEFVTRFQKYFSGTIYIALGIATAFSGNGRNK